MISIVTATYNAANCLDNLFKSILVQNFTDYEILIIDGGSTDGTIEIVKKYEHCISYWLSEKDGGIYDAWNKGIMKASGEWIMFLGADDWLMPDALQNYSDFLKSCANVQYLQFVSSKRQMVDKNGKLIRITGYTWEWPLFLKFMTVSHPGALHAKKLFDTYGLYNTDFKITGDYELLLRPKGRLIAAFMNKVTVNMSEGGASDSIAAVREYFKAVTDTGGQNKMVAFFNCLVSVSKFIVKKSMRKIGFNVYLQKA